MSMLSELTTADMTGLEQLQALLASGRQRVSATLYSSST